MWCIYFKCVIVVVGVIECYIGFVNNDCSGIMMVSVVCVYVNCWVMVMVKFVLVFINNDDGYKIVCDFMVKGVNVFVVVDICNEGLEIDGIEVYCGVVIFDIKGCYGVIEVIV